MHQTTKIFWHLSSSELTKLRPLRPLSRNASLWRKFTLELFFTQFLKKVSKRRSCMPEMMHGPALPLSSGELPTENAHRNKYQEKAGLGHSVIHTEPLLCRLTCCSVRLSLGDVGMFNLAQNGWLRPQLTAAEVTSHQMLTRGSRLARVPVQHLYNI